MSSWTDAVTLAPPDAIFGITEAFKKDPRPEKINLGVGAYRDDNGRPYVLSCVRKAEECLSAGPKIDKEYLPIDGLPDFCAAAAAFAYGAKSPLLAANRVATVQCISGTGALRVGSTLLARFMAATAGRKILLPTPTWGNHMAIMHDSGLTVSRYRYVDAGTNGLDLPGALEDLRAAPEGSIVLLHACAHNPTGVDPSIPEWLELLDVVRARRLVPFFDMAYQGFATGDAEADAGVVRLFASSLDASVSPVCLAQSFAKNMGLYSERVGLFSIVAADAATATRLGSQLRVVVRPMYSNPPSHGARVAALVMRDPALRAEWQVELAQMAARITGMRRALQENLAVCGSQLDWSHVGRQIGMFCYSGLRPAEVAALTADHGIYLTGDGRISIAGITSQNVKYLAAAIHKVTAKRPKAA